MKIQRALISVSDKTGILELAKELAAHGIEILSTGGTAKALQAAVRQQALDAHLDGLDDIASGIALRRHCHEKIADSRIRHSSSPLDPTTGLAATSAAAFSFAQGVELGTSWRDRNAEPAAALTTSRRAGKGGGGGRTGACSNGVDGPADTGARPADAAGVPRSPHRGIAGVRPSHARSARPALAAAAQRAGRYVGESEPPPRDTGGNRI